MAGVFDYSTTAGSNTTVGGVSIAEGMQAGLVNNGMRAMMADNKKWQLDWSGIVTAGTGNAYTITSNQGITAYADGLRFSFRADRNNTGAATLNVDSRGAKALRKATGGALAAMASDDIVAEAIYDVVYDLSSDVFVIVGAPGLVATAFAQTLLDDANQAAMQTTLGLVPGTNVQAYDATLTSLSGLTLAAGDLLYATGPDTLVKLAKGADGTVLTLVSGLPAWGGGVTYGTPQATTSGTAFDFNGVVPAAATEVTFYFRGVSLSGTDNILIQIGPTGGLLTTGYTGAASITDGGTASTVTFTTGFGIQIGAAVQLVHGTVTIKKGADNFWYFGGTIHRTTNATVFAGGSVDVGGALDKIRITRSGSNTFDAGEVNISWR